MGVLVHLAIITLTLVFRVASRNLAAHSFLQLSSNLFSGSIPYCENGEWISCEKVIVDLTSLRRNLTVILPHGTEVGRVKFSPGPEPGSTAAFYQSEDTVDSMSITFFVSGSKEVNAIIHEDGRVFSLAPCDQTGDDCHVLAEEDPDLFKVEGPMANATVRDLELMTRTAVERLVEVENRQERGRFQRDFDGTYVATIKIYYTRQFAQVEPNVNAFITNMISQANACFSNSKTQLRLRLLCTQQLNNITENRDPVQILTQFLKIKGTPANLRGTADFAHLLVRESDPRNCGVAYIGSTRVPFGVSKRVCAIGAYTFSHEIGHNLGCNHDRTNAPDADPNGYAFGYLIPGTPYRTTMAYWNSNHRSKLNIYANPSVRIQNIPVGNVHNDCARKIRENARTFASIGSDTESCASATATTTTIRPTSVTVISKCSRLLYRFVPTGSRMVVQYPASGFYGNFDQCGWVFGASRGQRLRVTIENMDIESQFQCINDSLDIYWTSQGSLRFCGTKSPYSYTSSSRFVCLRFRSNGSVVKSGFRVILQAY